MTVRWDNHYFASANAFMEKAHELRQEGQYQRSWKISLSARLHYLADCVVNLVILPFALLGVIAGAIHALCRWNLSILKPSKQYLLEKSNHFFISLCGTALSPTLAYKYKDANLAPLIITVRIAAIAMLYLIYA